jgi:hypothetical protein
MSKKGVIMSKELTFTVNIYSPRHGHDDRYQFTLTEQSLYIKGGKQATCTRHEDGNLSWSGHRSALGNPFVKILENDQIFPPSILAMAIESAWEAWLEDRLDDDQVREELIDLFDWVNISSRNKPHSDFWSGIF